MSYAESILPEFEQEVASTRSVLERIPEDKLDWRAHPKMNTIGWNANHIAETIGWVEGTLTQATWDIAPIDGEPYEPPKLTSCQEILELFDRNVETSRKAFSEVKDEAMGETWSLLQGGEAIMTMPRAAVIRSFVMNHLVHHRAHLCVYLRLNDVALPGMYGPSGDE